jgi:hypothetical protein
MNNLSKTYEFRILYDTHAIEHFKKNLNSKVFNIYL